MKKGELFERKFSYSSNNSKIHRTTGIKNSEIETYRRKTLDSSFKGIVFSYLYQVLYANNINRGQSSYIIAKEIFVTNQLVMYFQRNHFLTEKFNEKITIYLEAGIVQKILRRYVDFGHLKSRSHEKIRSVVSLNQLLAVFQVYFVGVFLSILTFTAEKLMFFIAARRENQNIRRILGEK